MKPRHIAVVDIGKTNAKLALVDSADLSEIDVVTTPNTVLDGPPYPHFDVKRIESFLLEALGDAHRQHGIDAISITTHGACGALLSKGGNLAAPILDYEHIGPDEVAKDYDALRPSFNETGSPRLPMGLNLGAQIHWQFRQNTTLRERTESIVTYPQYWGYRLTGNLACDVTSLGCHTDLWNPHKAEFSSLIDRLGISDKMAPARKPHEILGTLLPKISAQTGLKPNTPVLCGIHDSNASLLPHLAQRDPPFSVVSTGTWVIVMTVGGPKATLDPSRDALMNVNALGAPVPSARFMGGREYDIMQDGQTTAADATALNVVATQGPLLMPAVVPESGPFQGQNHRWIGPEPKHNSPERTAALSFYLALMTAECLSLTNNAGPIIVEGPFAANTGFCAMLAAASKCPVQATESVTGTSQGAALLALEPDIRPATLTAKHYAPEDYADFSNYVQRWQHASTRS